MVFLVTSLIRSLTVGNLQITSVESLSILSKNFDKPTFCGFIRVSSTMEVILHCHREPQNEKNTHSQFLETLHRPNIVTRRHFA